MKEKFYGSFVSGKGSGSVYTREYQVFLLCLVAARERSGLSQRALAEKLDRSYSYVAKCETGYVRMDIYQIRQYLDAVKMPFVEFMQEYEVSLMSNSPLPAPPR